MNQAHFDKLQEGVAAFNDWRDANSDDPIDLSGANLSGAVLDQVNFGQADLSNANLSGVKMDSGNLSGANLSGANLSQADLSYSAMSRANLSGANLSGTNLNGVFMSNANLSGANISGAILSSITAKDVNLTGVDLNTAAALTGEISRASTTRVVGDMQGVTKGKGPYSCTLTGTLTINENDFPARMEVAFDYKNGQFSGTFELFDETDPNSTLKGSLHQVDGVWLNFASTSDTGRFTGCVKGEITYNTILHQNWNISFV